LANTVFEIIIGFIITHFSAAHCTWSSLCSLSDQSFDQVTRISNCSH